MKKTCSICKLEKDIFDFYKKKDTKDGYTLKCRECTKNERKIYRKNNSNKIKENLKIHYQLNREELREKAKQKLRDSDEYKKRQLIKEEKQKKLQEIENELRKNIRNFIIEENIINNSELKNFILYNFLIKYDCNMGLNSVKLKKSWFINNKFEYVYNEILNKTEFLNIKNDVSLSERIYCILFDIYEIKKCLVCNENVKYPNFVTGYLLHCGKRECSYKLKSEIKDENGLTANEKSRLSTIEYMNTKDKNGISNGQKNGIKSVETKRNTILPNGLSIMQDSQKRCAITKMNTYLENGLTIAQNASLKSANTMKNIVMSGKTLSDIRIEKGQETKNKIVNGLDGYERSFLNGAGKNSSIKYYNTDLYYQGTYEKHFLDIMSEKNIINEIKRGPRFEYTNTKNKNRIYRSDFSYNNIVFEIKSDYTYGSTLYKKNERVIQELNEKRINNNIKFKNVLEKDYRLILIFNKKFWIELQKDDISNIEIDLYDEMELKDIKKLEF